VVCEHLISALHVRIIIGCHEAAVVQMNLEALLSLFVLPHYP
jgi:hypothetical protein